MEKIINKQLLTSALLVLLLFSTTTISSQSAIIEKGSVNKFLSGNDTISSCRITVKNSGAQNCLLWFNDNDKSKSFRNYFFRQIGDFNLYNIISEYSGGSMTINNIDLFHEMYKTFYKVILANDSFFIYVQCKNGDIVKKAQLVTNQICIIDSSHMNTNGSLNWTIGREFELLSYKSDYIILSY